MIPKRVARQNTYVREQSNSTKVNELGFQICKPIRYIEDAIVEFVSTVFLQPKYVSVFVTETLKEYAAILFQLTQLTQMSDGNLRL